MKVKVIAVRDRAVDAFQLPQYVSHIGAGIRGFADAINKADSAFGGHPEDYDLYELGEYEDGSGLFTTGVPRMIAVGKDLVKG